MQEQRRLERRVRYAKRDAAMYKAAGDEKAFQRCALRVETAANELKEYVAANPTLVLDLSRTWVYGYNRSANASAAAANRKTHAAQAAKTAKQASKQSAKAQKTSPPANSSIKMFENLRGAVVRDKVYESQLAKMYDSGSATAKAVFASKCR